MTEFEPLNHECPYETATDGAEAMAARIGDQHRKPGTIRTVCALRREATRFALTKHPCEAAVEDRDKWIVCPNSGTANSMIGITLGPNDGHVDVEAYGSRLEQKAKDEPDIGRTGQYL